MTMSRMVSQFDYVFVDTLCLYRKPFKHVFDSYDIQFKLDAPALHLSLPLRQ